MPILVTCPGCSAKLNAPDSAVGKNVKCPKPNCGTIVPVPAPKVQQPAFEVVEDEPPPAPPPKSKPRLIAAVEVEEDEPPRKKARRDDDDDRPRRKKRRDDDDDDDDDRPRRKKRRAAGGASGGIIALIVLGGLVLLGAVGFGIYALVGGSKAPVPEGWVEYTSTEDKFRAYFPEKPEPRTIPTMEDGVESITFYSSDVKISTQRVVMVQVHKFESGSTAAQREKVMEKIRKVPAEDKSKGRVSGPHSIRWAGYKAQEFILEDAPMPGGKRAGGVVRFFATDTHAYIAVLVAEGGRMSRAEEDGFFDNFEVLK
jgi:hypothetical protein